MKGLKGVVGVARARSFRRALTLWDLVMVNMAAIIGSGWLLAAMAAAGLAGPSAILAWLIGIAASLIIAPFFMELGTLFPETGSMARYAQYTQSPFVSHLVGWATFISWAAFSPLETVAMIQYGSSWVPGLYAHGSLTPPGFVVGALLMVGFMALNLLGMKLFARINNYTMFWKMIIPALTVVVLLVAAHHLANLTHGGLMPYGVSGMLGAVSSGGIILSLTGFRHSIDLAGEAKNPQRDVPRSIWISLLLAGTLYLCLEVAFVAAVPPAELGHGWAGLSFNAPYVDLALLAGLGWLALLLRIDAVISPADTALVNLTSASRTAHAMGRNGSFPPALTRLTDSGQPIVGLTLTWLVGFLFLLPFPSWRALAGVVSDVIVLTYIMGPIAVGVMRRVAPKPARHVSRVPWLSWWGPAGFIIGSLLIYWSGWPTIGKVMLVELAGVLVYAYYWAHHREDAATDHVVAKSAWFVVYLAVLTGLDYVGSFNAAAGAPHLLPAPWDSAAVAAVALAFYRWGVASGYETADLREVRSSLPAMRRGQVTQGESGFEMAAGEASDE